MMRRILVIGSGGAGKTVFSVEFAKRMHIPVVHLDAHRWDSRGNKVSDESFEKLLTPLLQQDSWIMDGNYGRFLAQRLPFADTVIFIDVPRWLCILRVLRRYIGNVIDGGTLYPDGRHRMSFFPDSFIFLHWVWRFPHDGRKRILELMKEHGKNTTFIQLRSHKEVVKFLEEHTSTQTVA